MDRSGKALKTGSLRRKYNTGKKRIKKRKKRKTSVKRRVMSGRITRRAGGIGPKWYQCL